MSHHQHSRRDFLRGETAVKALQDSLAQDVAEPVRAAKSFHLNLRRRAMACEFEVQLPTEVDDRAGEAALAALDLVEAIEDRLTVYRDDSVVQTMNRTAARHPVEVDPQLFALVATCAELHRETDGAFDPTSGPLSDLWGFSRRAGAVPTSDEIECALGSVGFDQVSLDPARRTIRFQSSQVTMNFNSIGKGYALDCAANLLAEQGVDTFRLHGGRSSVLARGSQFTDTDAGWQVGLRHPLRPTERLALFTLRDEALATSGAATQSFEHNGKRYGHVIDPRSGWPAEGVYTATAIAPSAARADALSTAFYVMGPEAVDKYCERHTDVRALLVCPSKRSGEVEVLRFNFPL